MKTSINETEFLQKYGNADMAPERKAKPPEPLITDAEWAHIDARRANAAYLGWPIKPIELNAPLNVLFAREFRHRADIKRQQVKDGTSHPENFPDVTIRSPEAAIAAHIAESLDALADDLEKMT